MIDTKRKWMIILLFITLKSSDVQFVMPQQIIPQQQPLICPPPSPGYLPPPACVPPFAHAPPVFALPPPQPLVAVVPIAFHIPDQYNGETLTKITTTSSTTTTTTERTIAIAVPLPIPMPIQYAIPAYPPPQYCQTVPIPKGCPPCPPCQCQPTCTPAFFSYCSPCHQKCRCRDRNEIPQPLPPMPPHPVPGPAYPYPVQMGRLPVIMIPYPPRRPRPYPKSDTSSSSGGSSGASCSSGSSDSSSPDSSDSSCQNSDKKKHRKHLRRKMRLRSFKRNFRPAKRDRRDHELVKPVFNYISDNGGVKLRRHISNMDAAELLEGSNSHGRKTKLYTETDDDQISDELKQANHHSRNTGKDINKQINFRNNLEDHIVGQGRKQLIFRPPGAIIKGFTSYPKNDVLENSRDTNDLQLLTNSVGGSMPHLLRPISQLSDSKLKERESKTKYKKSTGAGSKKIKIPETKTFRRDDASSLINATSTANKTATTSTIKITTIREVKTTASTAATTINEKTDTQRSCCSADACFPCPPYQPMPMPFYPMPVAPAPVIVPLRTVYEPVIHDHPPLHEIQEFIRKDLGKNKKRNPIYTSSSTSEEDTDYSDTNTSSSDTSVESDTSIDYYGEFMHVKG